MAHVLFCYTGPAFIEQAKLTGMEKYVKLCWGGCMHMPWGNGWSLLFIAVGILLVLFLLAPGLTKKEFQKKEYLVTVQGTIEKVLEDDLDDKGGRHQRLFVRVTKVLDDPENANMPRNENCFVAIRYGDKDGFTQRIQALDGAAGKQIEIRGRYIPSNPKNVKAPSAVIHFTHKPIGYIRYANKTYR